jgi:hypothetical protein
LVVVAIAAAWLSFRASTINSELSAAAGLIVPLKQQVGANDPERAAETVQQIRSHTTVAREAAEDPIWALASIVPWVGPNFTAAGEVARSADDVASLSLVPLVQVYSSLDWNRLLPSKTGSDLKPIQAAAPTVSSAANAVRLSAERLDRIDRTQLLPQVAEPIARAKDQLLEVTGALDAAADAARVIPGMLGSRDSKNFLLMIQNNAESRSSGGIPGALAVLTFDDGKLALGSQSSAGDVGIMSPALSVEPEQQAIYSGRLGKFMQDVNLTPDFPTTASLAQSMWERKTGQRVDGVISIDPIVLSYILDSTGPVAFANTELLALAGNELPTELTGRNVVPTLLSDVYAKISEPRLQDVYFAGVAEEIFGALSDGQSDSKGLMEGIVRGTQEGRVLVWSNSTSEQEIIAKYPVSGSITGPSVAPAQFGVYFNDGTGAKMDYYVKRSVQLLKGCAKDGYEETTVRITSTNTAPADAATSLPDYVTGGANFGVPEGSVQTNIVAYGPAQSIIDTARLDGQKSPFAPYIHQNRPVGVVAVLLAPGESQTLEFKFGKIVQHTEPNLFVTPGVHPVKDVVLPTQVGSCR